MTVDIDTPSGVDPDRICVMVVEDDPQMRTILAAWLGQPSAHIDAVFAEDLGTGMRLLSRVNPDVVLLDVGLPDVSYETVLDAIAAVSPWIAIVVLTGRNHDTEARCLRAGAEDYIYKAHATDAYVASSLRHAALRRRWRRDVAHTLQSIDEARGQAQAYLALLGAERAH